jgi:hypothetical protein
MIAKQLAHPSLVKVKTTRNRTAVLKCLTEPSADCGGQPPYCASDVYYMLEHNYEWYGAKKPVSISQIHRTLRDLLAAGVLVKETRIDEPLENGLPCRVNYYQLANAVERNAFLTEINQTLAIAEKCHGTFLFTTDHFFNEPFKTKEKAAVIADIKSLIQRSHSDKTAGFEYEVKQLNKALKYCRSDIDLLKTPNKQLKLR